MSDTPFFTPEQLKSVVPRTEQEADFVYSSRSTIQEILAGEDPRLLVIVGPCSIHNLESSYLYAKRLKKLSEATKDALFIVMRCYIEKARTKADWKGFMHNPFLNQSHAAHRGFELSRNLLKTLTDLELPLAMEFVQPLACPYFEDYISWGAIGARTVCSQPHRELASSLKMPIGFKNALDGSIENAINGILFAQCRHNFMHITDQGTLSLIQTKGNPFCHLILRGASNAINYDSASVQRAKDLLKRERLNEALIIDCAHDNAKDATQRKNHLLQLKALKEVLRQYLQGEAAIKGIMLESFLEASCQKYPITDSISITDPCLDFETTEKAIFELYTQITNKAKVPL